LAAAALTAVPATKTAWGVHGVFDIPTDIIRAQIHAVLTDFSVGAVKTGIAFEKRDNF